MVEVIMPKAGVDMQEGTIVSWFKKEGDAVTTGEPILEIVTDKVNMEVEAEGDGILAVITHDTEGEVLPVFTVIGAIAEKGEDLAKIKEQVLAQTGATSSAPVEEAVKVEETKTEAPAVDAGKYDYDVVIVGGGPAGYVAGIKAAMLGGKVAVVEADKFGGTCLNRGCIPTKTYMENVEITEAAKEFAKRGIAIKVEGQEPKKAVKYKNRVTKKLVAGVEGLLKAQGAKLFKTKATVKGANEVVLENGEVLSTANVIIATGSKVAMSDMKGAESDLVLTSTEALDLEEIPKTIAVVGSDFIAIEFAEIFNSRGSKVTIVSPDDEILAGVDAEVVRTLKGILTKKGIEILTKKEAEAFVEAEGKVVVKLADGEEVKADKALLALGREANLAGIENSGVKIDNGFVSVNDKMETSVSGIYAVGDVTGKDMTAHAAFAMGEVAAQNAMGKEVKFKGEASPKCLYTVPQVASVGLTEEEAKKSHNVKVGKFRLAANGKALAQSATNGFVKVVADEKYGEILGIHIIGTGATELVNEAAILKALEVPADEAADMIFAHPTVSEVLKEALADVNNESIHTPKK